jgi:hypothetical protein
VAEDQNTRHRRYRRSFQKTTWVAAVATVAGLALLAIAPLHLRGRARLLALLPVATLFSDSLIVLASGLLVLHRHARELTGQPDLFWLLLRKLEDHPPRGWIRRLIGPKLRAGTLVRVRGPREILDTLDDKGETDGIPFMPEMWKHCGHTFQVHRVVDKIHDWKGQTGTGLRRLKGFVTLRGIRCDGLGHGGCQAACQVLWHERWLVRSDRPDYAAQPVDHPAAWDVVARHCQRVVDGRLVYACQLTARVRASTPLKRWDIRQDLRPLISGNVDLAAFLVAVLTATFNAVQRLRGGMTYPMLPAQLASGPTPSQHLALQRNETVVVRDKAHIGQTLYRHHNRGLWFGAETMRFCGQSFRVRHRVERMLSEKTGEMLYPKTPFIVLEGATATGEFLRFCAQNEYVYWRDVWLERRSSRHALRADLRIRCDREPSVRPLRRS